MMRSPLEQIKQLPWLILLQAALITAVVLLAIEYLFWFISRQIPLVAQILLTLHSPGIDFVTSFAVSLGVGALAVLILEWMHRVVINTGILWGLFACVVIVVLIVQRLGLFPLNIVGAEYSESIGIVLGIFLKGQAYWKSYRRW